MDMNILMQPIMLLGASGLVGFLMGYFMKQFFKIIAFASGAILAVLAVLNYKGMIDVDWNVIATQTYNGALYVAEKTENVVRSVASEYDSGNVAIGFVGVGFIGGMIIGWRT